MASGQTIEQLVRMMQAGDEAAFNDLYERTSSHAYYLALQLVKDKEMAQDILQDAYIRALTNIGSLQDPSKFQGWLNSIVVNTGKNYLKKKTPVLFSQMSSEDDQDEPVDFEDESETFSPEANVDYSETKRLVKEMIDRLPERQRIPILLYYMEDYSVGQIAQAMECNESTIKSRLSAGRKQIKQDVLALEKQGTKLYCTPLVPFLFWMFHTPASAATISAAEAATLSAGVATGSAMGAATAAGTAVGSTVGTGSTIGAATASGTTAGAAVSAGSTVGATAMTGTTVGATVATGTAVTGAAASAGTAAAATGLSLAAKIGIVAALVACVGGGAVTGYVVTSNNHQGDSDTGIEAVSADWESEEPRPAPQNIVYEYDEIGDDFYEEHNNILGIMCGLMEAEERTGYHYESDDPALMWNPIFEYVRRYWPELDDGTGTIFYAYDADVERYGDLPVILVIPKDLIKEYTYVIFDGRTEDLPEDQLPPWFGASMDDDLGGLWFRTERSVDVYYPRVRTWIEHPDGSCTVFLYSFAEDLGQTENGVYSGPYQFELLPDPGSKYGYIVHDCHFIGSYPEEEIKELIEEVKENTRIATTAAATAAVSTGENQGEDNAANAITSKDGSVMPYKAIADEYSEDYYNLHISCCCDANAIIERNDYYEIPDCELYVREFYDADYIESLEVGDPIVVNGEEYRITSIETNQYGNQLYYFIVDPYFGEYSFLAYIGCWGNDPDREHGYTQYYDGCNYGSCLVYEGPVRFSKDVVILGNDGESVTDPESYFYQLRPEDTGISSRQHGYMRGGWYIDEDTYVEGMVIDLLGTIKVDDKGYVDWYQELYTS